MMLHIAKVREFSGHKGAVFALARHGNHLFSAGDDGIVARWDLNQPDAQGDAILQVERSVYALLALPDGRLLAGMSDGTLHLWLPGDRTTLQSKRWLTTSIYSLAINALTGEIWALCGEGMLLRIAADETLELVQQVKLATGNLRGVAPIANGQVFVGTAEGETVQVSPDGHPVARWKAHELTTFSLMWDANRQVLYSGGRDALLKTWAFTDRWEERTSIAAHLFTLNAISPSPDGSLFVTASRDKTLKLWDTADRKLLKVIDFQRNYGHTHSVNSVVWLDNTHFISAGDDRRIIWWQIGEA